jgi:hypothetical protein
MNTRAFLISAVLISGLFGGCATMFKSRQEIEVIGSPDIEVQNVHGGKLPGFSTGEGVIVTPDPSRTDSIKIVYGTKSTTVALAKNLSGWSFLNVFSYGVGFTIDDLNHSWFNYAPVYVTIDSSSRGLEGITASTFNWLGEPPGYERPRLLLTGGVGLTFQSTGGGALWPFGSGDFPTPLVNVQLGIGVDFYKQVELFILARNDFSYPLNNNGEGASAEINTADICLRYFFHKNLFLQGSIGRGSATDFGSDYIIESVDGVTTQSTSSPSFNEVGAAIGWAGDISYISLQYFGGLTAFSTPDYSNIRYHTIYLNFGLNFRI